MGNGVFKSRKYVPASATGIDRILDELEVPLQAAPPHVVPRTDVQEVASGCNTTAEPGLDCTPCKAPYLRTLPIRSLLKLARAEDADAAKRCLERRELEELLISRLGVDRVDRLAYMERPDVKEAQGLCSMLGRMVCETRSLESAVQEKRDFVEVRLKIELAKEPLDAEWCTCLTSHATECTDQVAAVQMVLNDVQEEATNLAVKIADGYKAPGVILEPVNELADRAFALLATLSPAAQSLGDVEEVTKHRLSIKSQGAPDIAANTAKDVEDGNSRTQNLNEMAAILRQHKIGNIGKDQGGPKRPMRQAECNRLFAERDRLLQQLDLREEREDLREEREDLWAELDELERDRDEPGENVYDRKERQRLENENAELAAELEKQLQDMKKVLEFMEEDRRAQVGRIRKKKIEIELDDNIELAGVTIMPDEMLNDVGIKDGIGIAADGTLFCDGYNCGNLTLNDVEFFDGPPLGSGASGVVTKGVLKKTGSNVAIKTMFLNEPQKREQVLREIQGLAKAQGCSYLVQWYAGFASANGQSVHVVLEFLDLGSLWDMGRRLKGKGVPLEQLACISKQVVLGLDFLHERRLLHRDIKPPNILHNRQGQVKLTDFGIAKEIGTPNATTVTFVGTSTYMAPERYVGEEYGFPSDVWSAGVVFFELASGKYPFSQCTSFIMLYNNICEMPEPRLKVAAFPASVRDFVSKCMFRDESKRPSTKDLRAHEFLSDAEAEGHILVEWLTTLF